MSRLQDLTGAKFGRLTVLQRETPKNGRTMWKCLCDCGNEKTVEAYNLKSGHIRSCGCLNSELTSERNTCDLKGKRFGRLVAKEKTRYNGKISWICSCDCGNTTIVLTNRLTSGKTRSCGCLLDDYLESTRGFTFGESNTRIYKIYQGMLRRCSPYYHGVKNYYDKGVRVCDEWQGEHGFEHFRDWSLANGYDESKHWTEMTIDRIDNDGNYEPSNCRWTTAKQQCNNMSTNVLFTYMGKTQTMKQWCEELDLSYGMVKARHRKGIEPPELFAPKSA